VQPAARRSDRVRMSWIRCTAVHWPVSERDGDVGNGPSGRAMPTTARARRSARAQGHRDHWRRVSAHAPVLREQPPCGATPAAGGAGCKDGRIIKTIRGSGGGLQRDDVKFCRAGSVWF
jgi:hypothetical protein